jgi:hypothetical protein
MTDQNKIQKGLLVLLALVFLVIAYSVFNQEKLTVVNSLPAPNAHGAEEKIKTH